MVQTGKHEHSRKPDELYPIIEACMRSTSVPLSTGLFRADLRLVGGLKRAVPARLWLVAKAT